MNRPVVVLGATGSIGTQTLEVADRLGLEVAALAARRPTPQLAAIARRYPDASVAVAAGSRDQRDSLTSAIGGRARFGSGAVLEMAALPGSSVVNGIVGSAGLAATVSAIEAGNRVALANKESLVAGGPVVRQALARGGELIPVDSEHSALFQCLAGESADAVARLVLTASGGPFRGATPGELAGVTREQALAHPVWDMGPRITVDSATLFNKGMEVIEAHFLFDVPYDRIEVVVHPQSVLHSAIEFVDGSWKGHFGQPDMRIPIQYALTHPGRARSPVPPFDLAGRDLTFEEPDRKTFPALDLAYEAGRRGGSAPAVLNAADEVAVEAFLQGRLGFTGIGQVLERALDEVPWRELQTVEQVLEVDRETRRFAAAIL